MELAILMKLCIVICMDGTYLCMNGWNLLMYEQCVWMKLMWYVIWNLCAGYVLDMWYETYIFSVQIVGFNKKQKKQTICRLFAVCHRRQRALCHQQRTAKRPRGRQLCFLGGWPIWSVCLQWLTAKRKKNFAYSGGRQRTADVCRQRPTAKACR